MSELAKHRKRRHPDLVDELKEGNFFSEGNGFWLALRPMFYAKAVKPSDLPNLMAIRTRTALIGWLERRGDQERGRQYWESGCNKALGITPVHVTPIRKGRWDTVQRDRT